MLELYHWEPNGPYLKPLIVLYEKGLAFRGRYVDVLAFEQHRAGFPEPSRETTLNLEGEGPLLLHEGRQITESLFIAQYLEDAFPDIPLRPREPIGHARALAWARFINEVFMPGANTLGCQRYLVPQLSGRDLRPLELLLPRIPMSFLQEGWRRAMSDDYPVELIAESRRKVALAVRRIDDALTRSEWLVGDTYSLADIDAFAICNALPLLTPDLVSVSGTPRLLAWLERIRARPAVRAALALSRNGRPEEAFAPGPEHSRWG
jgi:glutathione S-transferase